MNAENVTSRLRVTTDAMDSSSQGDGRYKEYTQLAEPHVASFDYFVREGLARVVKSVKPVSVRSPNRP